MPYAVLSPWLQYGIRTVYYFFTCTVLIVGQACGGDMAMLHLGEDLLEVIVRMAASDAVWYPGFGLACQFRATCSACRHLGRCLFMREELAHALTRCKLIS